MSFASNCPAAADTGLRTSHERMGRRHDLCPSVGRRGRARSFRAIPDLRGPRWHDRRLDLRRVRRRRSRCRRVARAARRRRRIVGPPRAHELPTFVAVWLAASRLGAWIVPSDPMGAPPSSPITSSGPLQSSGSVRRGDADAYLPRCRRMAVFEIDEDDSLVRSFGSDRSTSGPTRI